MLEYSIFTKIPDNIENGDGVIIIPGNPVIKKNSRTFSSTGYAPNKKYAPYEQLNIEYLKQLKLNIPPINYPVIMVCTFYRESDLRCDLSNLYEAPQDLLVRTGILEDDNFKIVVGHDGSRVKKDKNFPRTEIRFIKASQA